METKIENRMKELVDKMAELNRADELLEEAASHARLSGYLEFASAINQAACVGLKKWFVLNGEWKSLREKISIPIDEEEPF